MTALRKRFIPNDLDRARVLPLFCGPTKEVSVSKVDERPKPKSRWLAPQRDANGRWCVKCTDGRVEWFVTRQSADEFFEEKVGLK